MTTRREGLRRTLEDAFASRELSEHPGWHRLRDWLESRDHDPDVVIAAFEAEYEQVPFPDGAAAAYDVLARYLPPYGEVRSAGPALGPPPPGRAPSQRSGGPSRR